MNTDPESEFEFFRKPESVDRFENMLANDDQYYFDVEDLEELVDHYMYIDIDKAWKALELASQQHPHNREFELRRADILAQKGDERGAMRSIALLESIDPTDLDVLILKGSIHSKLNRHDEAIAIFRGAMEHAEDKSELYMLISYEYETMGNRPEAIAQLKAGLRENPMQYGLLYEIAFLYDVMDDAQGGIDFLNRYLDDHPYASPAWFNLANFHRKAGDYPRAIWALEMCTAIDDQDVFALEELGECYLESENYHRAEAQYRALLEMEDEDVDAMVGLARCAMGRQDLERAFKLYRKAAKTDPDFQEAYYGMATVCEKQGKYEQSLSYLRKSVKVDERFADGWFMLGEMLERFGEYEEAGKAFDKAVELAPVEKAFLIARANLMFHHLDRESGVEHMLEAIKTTPEDAELHYRIAAMLLMVGKSGDAMHFLQNGLEMDYSRHMVLFEENPEAVHHPRVLDLINIYGQ